MDLIRCIIFQDATKIIFLCKLSIYINYLCHRFYYLIVSRSIFSVQLWAVHFIETDELSAITEVRNHFLKCFDRTSSYS